MLFMFPLLLLNVVIVYCLVYVSAIGPVKCCLTLSYAAVKTGNMLSGTERMGNNGQQLELHGKNVSYKLEKVAMFIFKCVLC